MITPRLLLLLIIAAFATGCPKPQYRPTVRFNQGLVNEFNAGLKKQYRAYECYSFGPAHIDFEGNVCTGFTKDLDKAQAIRNEVIENALPYVDSAYNDFVTDLQAGRDRDNFLLDAIELGATGASGIVNGERSLQVIGVALTAFRGGRRSIDANFYKDTSIPILISKMDGNRAQVRATILARETKPTSEYQMGAAVSDIIEYYNAGSLVRAFTKIQQDTAIATNFAETHLKNLKEAGVKGAPSEAELKSSKVISEAFSSLWKAYQDARKSVVTQEGRITAADQAVSQANSDIEQADKDIVAATERSTAAKTKAAKTQAEADKTKAEADKLKAEANKAKAEGEKTAAETAKTEAVAARDKAFDNLKGTYEAIEADAKLLPLLNLAPNDPDFSPKHKADVAAMLQRRKERKPIESDADQLQAAKDYATLLFQFGGMVAESVDTDATISERLLKILKVNQ